MKQLAFLLLLTLLVPGAAAVPTRALLLGPPGTGKTVQAGLLAEREHLFHLAATDLVRNEVRAGTPLGQQALPYLKAGKSVPDDIAVAMVVEKLKGHTSFILEGFPRTLEQGRKLQLALPHPLTMVVLLEVPDEVGVQRLSTKRHCPQCNTAYNTSLNPPKVAGRCDLDGAVLEQRDDDRPENVRARLAYYHQRTEPLVDFYREAGVLVTVDANRPPDQVTADLLRLAPR